MISKTSFKKWPIYKGALKRLKWLSILYAVALFMVLPLKVWMELSYQKTVQGELWAEAVQNISLQQAFFNPLEQLLNISIPVIFGLILFYYLQTERGSTFFHSLPVKRQSLYAQNLLAGLTMIWVPILLNGFLVYAVYASFGATEGQWYRTITAPPGVAAGSFPAVVPLSQVFIYWLFRSLLLTGIFYLFTVFVGMLTGNVLLQGVLTYIGLVLPIGIDSLARFSLQKLLYGYPQGFSQATPDWLSPIANYLRGNHRLLADEHLLSAGYLALAAVICATTIFLYKKRHVEAAGETLTANWIRVAFKYGTAFCAALLGGFYLSAFNQASTGALYLGYCIGAALGYIVADMIAYKSFRFYEHWKGMVIFGGIFILLIAAVKLDIGGYEKYVPEQNQIKEVFIGGLNQDGLPTPASGLKEKDNIRHVRLLHQQIIRMEKENKAFVQAQSRQGPASFVKPPVDTLLTINITYTLVSGREVNRTYTIDASRYRDYLYPIVASAETKRNMYSQLFKMSGDQIDKINVNNFHLNRNITIYKPAEIAEALAALRKDALNVSYEAVVEKKVPVQASIEFIPKTDTKHNYDSYNTYNLSDYTEFKNFNAFLSAHGYRKDLFLEPEDMVKMLLKETGTGKTIEITDKHAVLSLLNWCYLEDERSFIAREGQQENKDGVFYYGKLILKNGSTMYIAFDTNPYVQQLISGISPKNR